MSFSCSFVPEGKNGREVSLYEPIGTDKEGNEISLLDILESSDGDIAEAMDFRKNLRRLYKILTEP